MESVRRFVFPVIWMLLVALIAAALIKVAFFSGGDTATADGATPAASADQYATVPVARGDIASTLNLDATVTPEDSTPLKATGAGEISTLWVKDGDHVAQGDRILQVKAPREDAASAAAPAAAADGSAPASPTAAAPQYRYLTLTAPADGTIRDLSALKGQTIAIGDTVASVSPGTYAIVAALTPEQQLQLLDRQISASASLPDSADPVPCQAPSVKENASTAQGSATAAATPAADAAGTGGSDTSGGDQQASSSAASLRCPVPAGTKIVPGLTVKVAVDLGTASGVLTLPTTAVEGTGTAGTVYTLGDDGKPAAKKVTLGKRGDDVVEVTGGVSEGEKILRYVPGVNADDSEGQDW